MTPPPMDPAEVPEGLVDDAVDGWHAAPHDELGRHTVLLDDVMRHVLAAVLPAHRALVLEQVACQPPGTVVMTDAEIAEHDAAIRQQVREEVADQLAEHAARWSELAPMGPACAAKALAYESAEQIARGEGR